MDPATGSWDVVLEAPAGESLHVGRYEDAVTAQAGSGRAGISVIGLWRGCNHSSGTFTIRDLHVADDGSIDRIAVSFESHCEGASPAAFGEFVLNEPVTSTVHSMPDTVGFPDTDQRTAHPAVTSVAGVDKAYAPGQSVSWSTTGDAADFVLGARRCDPASGTCTVEVSFVPTRAGRRQAVLTMMTPHGSTSVHLVGNGVAGETSFTYRSDGPAELGGGARIQLTGADMIFSPSVDVQGVFVGMVPQGRLMSVRIAGPPGRDLQPGHYADPADSVPRGPEQAFMDVDVTSLACQPIHSSLDIEQLDLDQRNGRIRHLVMSYAQACQHGALNVSGELRYRALGAGESDDYVSPASVGLTWPSASPTVPRRTPIPSPAPSSTTGTPAPSATAAPSVTAAAPTTALPSPTASVRSPDAVAVAAPPASTDPPATPYAVSTPSASAGTVPMSTTASAPARTAPGKRVALLDARSRRLRVGLPSAWAGHVLSVRISVQSTIVGVVRLNGRGDATLSLRTGQLHTVGVGCTIAFVSGRTVVTTARVTARG